MSCQINGINNWNKCIHCCVKNKLTSRFRCLRRSRRLFGAGLFRAITCRTKIGRLSTSSAPREIKNKIPWDKDVVVVRFTPANCTLLSSRFDRRWCRRWSSGLPIESETKESSDAHKNRRTYKSSSSESTMVDFLEDRFMLFLGDCFPLFFPQPWSWRLSVSSLSDSSTLLTTSSSALLRTTKNETEQAKAKRRKKKHTGLQNSQRWTLHQKRWPSQEWDLYCDYCVEPWRKGEGKAGEAGKETTSDQTDFIPFCAPDVHTLQNRYCTTIIFF